MRIAIPTLMLTVCVVLIPATSWANTIYVTRTQQGVTDPPAGAALGTGNLTIRNVYVRGFVAKGGNGGNADGGGGGGGLRAGRWARSPATLETWR